MDKLRKNMSLWLLAACCVVPPCGFAKSNRNPAAPATSPKLASGHANPLLDFLFTADPTAVEHDGRLYVYATNDHQQYETVGREGRNTYEHIKSLAMLSTDDMVNWTFHGVIRTDSIAPWIIASWAPSIIKRKESDGQTHFYLYFSNSGFGTGVLTATSPVGPWSSPLDKSLIDANSPGLGDCKVPFDPGAVIDGQGNGWLAFGAGTARIMRLGPDLTSIGSEIKEIKAPHHFEANELNYINDTFVYTYNTDWKAHDDWSLSSEKPTQCSMVYMTSPTPLDPDSWQYGNNYLKNPGDYGFDYSNNHTHLQKFKGRWYIFYHTLALQRSFNTDGGFRSVCADEIEVDENAPRISMGRPTLKGATQTQPLDPFATQQAETTAATQDIRFRPAGEPGNLWVAPQQGKTGIICVRGARFSPSPSRLQVVAAGQGTIEVHLDSPDGRLLASVDIDQPQMKKLETGVQGDFQGHADLFLILKGDGLWFDSWNFK